MNTKRTKPPALAVWLLQRFYPKRNREAIIGDLVENFREGCSEKWFWCQVLVAVPLGASSQLRLQWTEICLASAGTVLTCFLPWGRFFPTAEMSSPMNWGARLPWLLAIEIVTALMVLPLFAVLFHFSRTLSWANLSRAFFVCALLFGAGDLISLRWCERHPVMGASQALWTVALQVGWIFAALLIATRAARRPLSSANATST